MKVAEIMQTNLKTVSTDATSADAVDALATTGVSALPVIDRAGRAVGVISTREVLTEQSACDTPAVRERLFESRRARAGSPRVLRHVAPSPTAVDPAIYVRRAAQVMLYLNVQRLFVEFDGALVGVISQTDIVGAVEIGRASCRERV